MINSCLSWLAKSVILFLSFPQIVMRMRFSVPEGRTSRRPAQVDLTFCSNCDIIELMASDAFSFDFCAGVASKLTITWGNLVMIEASSLREDFC